ncbi:exodeoxyribonuclease III [Verrucomicrobiaceae bacterium N1E253]|uniref:Exodeoxyribonuclease III n=1 Tax=Oceaniferula marina TaxID=2748318 RepID=A0A851GFQ6_9BACT|nr:exodeoxyribonuclease III [Oceaniferula marina]NWK54611.1 exodeoxyribonuclease III [Oceaniferula marina]
MRLISWNVNGIRAVLKKNFTEFVLDHAPDVLCLQETKARPEQVDIPLELAGYKCYWNAAEKPGYSGTAIFSKSAPIEVSEGIGIEEHDTEGRVITAEYQDFYLVTVYTPNSQNELKRLPYRQEWDAAFLGYCKNLEEKKPVVFCGDLNVSHREIDLARPKQNRKNAGFSDQERAGFDNILDAGFIDSFRHFYPDQTDAYSWWSYRAGARGKNIGWRLDYFCVSSSIIDKVESAGILSDVLGSDHCPVLLEAKLK